MQYGKPNRIFVDGKTLNQISKESGIKLDTIQHRYSRGDRTYQELTRPIHTGRGMGAKKKLSMYEAGSRFLETLNEKDINITMLAKRCGISRSLIYSFCYDGTDISSGRLMRMCAEIGVSIDYICLGDGYDLRQQKSKA